MSFLPTNVRMLLSAMILFLFSFGVITSGIYAFETSLKTVEANHSEVKGTFTLILYGGSYYDDLETTAILDYEGDGYTFEPYAPEFDYRIKKNMPAKEALAAAQKFVSFNPSFRRSQLSKIVDNKGNAIGYELRPLYYPITYGVSDVLDVHYWLKENGKIKVTIRLIPSVERLRFPGGGNSGGGGGN